MAPRIKSYYTPSKEEQDAIDEEDSKEDVPVRLFTRDEAREMHRNRMELDYMPGDIIQEGPLKGQEA
jgi:hypothetical protein